MLFERRQLKQGCRILQWLRVRVQQEYLRSQQAFQSLTPAASKYKAGCTGSAYLLKACGIQTENFLHIAFKSGRPEPGGLGVMHWEGELGQVFKLHIGKFLYSQPDRVHRGAERHSLS